MNRAHFIWLPAAVIVVSACASAPTSPAASTVQAPMSCTQLQAAATEARKTRDAAQHQAQDAWKAVLPFAVAARHASGSSAATEAGRRLSQLEADLDRQGCERHGE